MYTVFLAGGIASGKSTLARLLEDKGAVRIDLDEISREVLAAGSPLLRSIADTFGDDLVDSGGNLNRGMLARRAFATQEATRQLELIELPAILEALKNRLECITEASPNALCVVEVPRLDKMGNALALADEIDVVVAPLEERLARAEKKGITPQEFTQRAALQPSDEELLKTAARVWSGVDTPLSQDALDASAPEGFPDAPSGSTYAPYVIQNAGNPLDLEAAAVAIARRSAVRNASSTNNPSVDKNSRAKNGTGLGRNTGAKNNPCAN